MKGGAFGGADANKMSRILIKKMRGEREINTSCFSFSDVWKLEV